MDRPCRRAWRGRVRTSSPPRRTSDEERLAVLAQSSTRTFAGRSIFSVLPVSGSSRTLSYSVISRLLTFAATSFLPSAVQFRDSVHRGHVPLLPAVGLPRASRTTTLTARATSSRRADRGPSRLVTTNATALAVRREPAPADAIASSRALRAPPASSRPESAPRTRPRGRRTIVPGPAGFAAGSVLLVGGRRAATRRTGGFGGSCADAVGSAAAHAARQAQRRAPAAHAAPSVSLWKNMVRNTPFERRPPRAGTAGRVCERGGLRREPGRDGRVRQHAQRRRQRDAALPQPLGEELAGLRQPAGERPLGDRPAAPPRPGGPGRPVRTARPRPGGGPAARRPPRRGPAARRRPAARPVRPARSGTDGDGNFAGEAAGGHGASLPGGADGDPVQPAANGLRAGARPRPAGRAPGTRPGTRPRRGGGRRRPAGRRPGPSARAGGPARRTRPRRRSGRTGRGAGRRSRPWSAGRRGPCARATADRAE